MRDVVQEQEPDLYIEDGSKHHKSKDKDGNKTVTDDDGNNDDVTIHIHLNIHDIHIYIPVLEPTLPLPLSSLLIARTEENTDTDNLLPIEDDQTRRIQFADEVGRFVNAVRLKSYAKRILEKNDNNNNNNNNDNGNNSEWEGEAIAIAASSNS